MSTSRPREAPAAPAVLAALTLLYAAQGIPFGFAAEYLPVVLREGGATRSAIAAVGWLQLPWQLKPLWAGVADHPRVRPRARAALLAVQLTLAAVMTTYAFVGGHGSYGPWFALTGVAAFLAATQDVFVDAFAVRTLTERDRGWGNSAQIAGYRVGMILGGGGMLALSALAGTSLTLVACGVAIALAALGAFALRDTPGADADAAELHAPTTRARPHLAEMLTVLRGLFRPEVRAVTALAVTYKFGIHAAAGLIKPMLVDAHWTREAIGALAVTLGAAAAVLGSLAGGALHRALGERRALVAGLVAQAIAVLPLVAAAATGCPRGLTSAAVAIEHGASGLGTTVLFAALMTATQRDRAALHYTVLTSLNALAIGLGGQFGALVGDLAGVGVAYGVAAALCLAPWMFLGRWEAHAKASAGEV